MCDHCDKWKLAVPGHRFVRSLPHQRSLEQMDSPKICCCCIFLRMQQYVKNRENPQRFVGEEWDSPMSLLLLEENSMMRRKRRESLKICFFGLGNATIQSEQKDSPSICYFSERECDTRQQDSPDTYTSLRIWLFQVVSTSIPILTACFRVSDSFSSFQLISGGFSCVLTYINYSIFCVSSPN